jgi:hypothetical protein
MTLGNMRANGVRSLDVPPTANQCVVGLDLFEALPILGLWRGPT